jgi:hypothetical protein
MDLFQAAKQNPAKILFGSASSIVAIIGSLFALDARYAHADDLDKVKVETKEIVREYSLNFRKQMLEDKLFELEMKRTASRDNSLSQVDQALYERYKRQSLELGAPK